MHARMHEMYRSRALKQLSLIQICHKNFCGSRFLRIFQILSQRVFFFEEEKLNLGDCLVMTNWDFKIHCKLRQSIFWVRILDLRNAFWIKRLVEDVKMVNISGTIEQKNHEMQNRKLSFWLVLSRIDIEKGCKSNAIALNVPFRFFHLFDCSIICSIIRSTFYFGWILERKKS